MMYFNSAFLVGILNKYCPNQLTLIDFLPEHKITSTIIDFKKN